MRRTEKVPAVGDLLADAKGRTVVYPWLMVVLVKRHSGVWLLKFWHGGCGRLVVDDQRRWPEGEYVTVTRSDGEVNVTIYFEGCGDLGSRRKLGRRRRGASTC